MVSSLGGSGPVLDGVEITSITVSVLVSFQIASFSLLQGCVWWWGSVGGEAEESLGQLGPWVEGEVGLANATPRL